MVPCPHYYAPQLSALLCPQLSALLCTYSLACQQPPSHLTPVSTRASPPTYSLPSAQRRYSSLMSRQAPISSGDCVGQIPTMLLTGMLPHPHPYRYYYFVRGGEKSGRYPYAIEVMMHATHSVLHLKCMPMKGNLRDSGAALGSQAESPHGIASGAPGTWGAPGTPGVCRLKSPI